MKISRIKVDKLFGVFDHDILLNKEDGITIVIGENGLGKTVILEAINALFERDFRFFSSLEFKMFHFYFDNGDVWELTKNVVSDGFSLHVLSSMNTKNRPTKIFEESTSNNRSSKMRERQLMLQLEYEKRKLLDRQRDLLGDRDFGFEREYEYKKRMEMHHRMQLEESNVKQPQWFTDTIKEINVKLIDPLC